MSALATVSALVTTGGEWIKLALETLGAITIASGMVAALVGMVRGAAGTGVSFATTRFTLARYLALALEFQLAGDILETAMSPDWQRIGQLAAIATIRTALNYFLSRELADERREVAAMAAPPR